MRIPSVGDSTNLFLGDTVRSDQNIFETKLGKNTVALCAFLYAAQTKIV
jgi:hypothetical protein